MEDELEFDGQRPNENAVMSKHQHPWVLAKAGIIVIFAIVLVFLDFLLLRLSTTSVIIGLVLVLFIIFYCTVIWFSYANTLFILTNERIISVKQKGLFKRRFQEIELNNIYALSYKTEGLLKTLLNFGEVRLTTEGDTTDCVVLENYENPHFIHEKISHLMNKTKE